MDELAFLPALEQARLVRARELSPVELVEVYLRRIERLDPQLNAYVTVAAERALAEAARPLPDDPPPFFGVPISIKDLNQTGGIRTTFSSRVFADFVPAGDAAVVRRIREAGLVVLGKTNTPEFGTIALTESELNGVCRNPWDISRTPGGSSGGAAAAVAAGLCSVAHGSDGGGSIRIPASCCGLFGLKPSRGRVSDAPYASTNGLGTNGPIARTVADAAALLDVMSGYEPGDPHIAPPPERPFAAEPGRDPGRLRVALVTEPPTSVAVDPACRGAAEDAAHLLAELGHDVEEAAPPWSDPELMHAFARVWEVGPGLYVDDPALLTPMNRWLFESAGASSSVDYVRAFVRLLAFGRRMLAAWRWDVLLTPTLALPPVPVGWDKEAGEGRPQFARNAEFAPFTQVANVTGQPAVSVPLAWSDDGLPLGVQLVGPPHGEAMLLRLAAQLEAARPWADRRPPLT